MRPALAVDGGQVDAVGLHRLALGFARLLQPLREQGQRVERRFSFLQATEGVVATHLGKGQRHGGDLL
ncbi:hypothetical protein D3C84_1196370 [compost metagenome]